MEGVEEHEPPRFCIELNLAIGRWKIAVVQLHHGATLEGAVETTIDLHCKTVCFNQVLGEGNIIVSISEIH
jgi:hypothetical protein